MKTNLSKLTIVAEALLKDRIVEMIRKKGATGYTLTYVEGEGSRGTRASDWEGRNLQLETIVAPEVADVLLEELGDTLFQDFAIIAWVVQVEVLRGNKFAGDSGED